MRSSPEKRPRKLQGPSPSDGPVLWDVPCDSASTSSNAGLLQEFLPSIVTSSDTSRRFCKRFSKLPGHMVPREQRPSLAGNECLDTPTQAPMMGPRLSADMYGA